MLKDYFVKQGIKEVEIEEFIRKKFPLGDYSKTEIQRTPLGIKIVIYTNKPGRIIGRGGKNINDMTDALKARFELENPQLDVKVIPNANLDAKIVAKQIASALEKGYNFKKICNLTIKRVMGAGAIGVQIVVAGKLTGGKGMTGKFTEGYIKYAGQPAEDLVDTGFEEAQTQPGKIGVRVRITKEFMDITGETRDYIQRKTEITPEDDEKETGEGQEEKKAEAGETGPEKEKEDNPADKSGKKEKGEKEDKPAKKSTGKEKKETVKKKTNKPKASRKSEKEGKDTKEKQAEKPKKKQENDK